MTDASHLLDISAAPAVVEWADTDGKTRYLPESLACQIPDRVSFDLYFDTSSKSSFKLHIPLINKSFRNSTPLYLFIPPERVAALYIKCSGVPNDVTKQLGTNVTRLRFDLNKPADLITPRFDLSPKNNLYKGNVYVSATLAQHKTITIYVACRLSKEQLRPLCDAISSGKVPSTRQTNLGGLYQGKGGRVWTDVDALRQTYLRKPSYSAQDGPPGAEKQDGTSAAVSVPPPYLPLPPTVRSSFVNPRKRPRDDSAGLDETSVNTDEKDADNSGAHVTALQRLEAESYSRKKRFEVMNEEMQAAKEELVKTKREHQATNRKLKATIKELLATRKALRRTKQSTRQKLQGNTQKANRRLQAATQMMQATKHATGQALVEVRECLDHEVMALHRLLRGNVELFAKTQERNEERSCEVVQLLKGLMGVVSQVIGHEDVSPEAEAPVAFIFGPDDRDNEQNG